MSFIKVAVIGCGRVAFHHAKMMMQIPEIRIVAACDINVERGESFAKEFNVPFYKSYHDMLKTVETDVVSIITPSGMHPFHALEVINLYKKHVVIEKPIVLNLDHAEELEAAAKNKA